MHSSPRAQSLLEYAMLASVIIAAIIIGGPVLLNSISAHFKIADDATQDAFSEKINQAAVPNKPGPGCICSPSIQNPEKPSSWPASSCGVGNCAEIQRYHHRTCSPAYCAQEAACITDPQCCTQPKTQGCGVLINAPSSSLHQCFGRTTADPRFQSGLIGTCKNSSGVDTQKCAIGEKLYTIGCGSSIPGSTATDTLYACNPGGTDHADCLPSCWETPSPNSTSCGNPGGEIDLIDEVITRKNLADRPLALFTAIQAPNRANAFQIPYAYVNGNASCTTNPATRACEQSCDNADGYYAAASGCTNACRLIIWTASAAKINWNVSQGDYDAGSQTFTYGYNADNYWGSGVYALLSKIYLRDVGPSDTLNLTYVKYDDYLEVKLFTDADWPSIGATSLSQVPSLYLAKALAERNAIGTSLYSDPSAWPYPLACVSFFGCERNTSWSFTQNVDLMPLLKKNENNYLFMGVWVGGGGEGYSKFKTTLRACECGNGTCEVGEEDICPEDCPKK